MTKTYAWLVAVLLAPSIAAAQAVNSPAVLDQGRALTKMFYDGKFEALWMRFSPQMQAAIGSVAKLRQFQEGLKGQMGPEIQVLKEIALPYQTYEIYDRLAVYQNLPQQFDVQWTLGPKDEVAGFFIRAVQDPADSPFLDYKTKSQLRLPFDDAWLVFWGGRSVYENKHAAAADQRFAYDFDVVKDGRDHTGDGTKVEQYYCFGQPILADANGTVAEVEDGFLDNPVGKPGGGMALGNHVVIDHGNGEYSFFAHLKQGSIRPKVGSKVKAGEVIGECGNSGNSPVPHLHYHLQNTPEPFKGQGLPAQFHDYFADGKAVALGEPVRGQLVQPR